MHWFSRLWVRQLIAMLLAVFFLLVVLDELANVEPQPPVSPSTLALKNLALIKAQAHNQDIMLTLLADVMPVKTIEISAQVAGRVVQVNEQFQRGNLLNDQQALLKLDDRDYQLALTHAQSSFIDAKLNLENQRTLYGKTSLKVELAEVQLEAAKLQLAKAKFDLASTQIKMPFAGELIDIKAHQSEFINIGQSIASALPESDRRIVVAVSERLFDRLQLNSNQHFTLSDLNSAKQWQARLTGYSNNAQGMQRLVYLTVTQAQSQGLLYGQKVHVHLPVQSWQQTARLPESSLTAKAEVYFLDGDNRLQKKQLTDYFQQDSWLYFDLGSVNANSQSSFLRYPRPSLLIGTEVSSTPKLTAMKLNSLVGGGV